MYFGIRYRRLTTYKHCVTRIKNEHSRMIHLCKKDQENHSSQRFSILDVFKYGASVIESARYL